MLDADPAAPVVLGGVVLPAAEPELDMLWSMVPVTSTRLPVFEASSDSLEPGSRIYVFAEALAEAEPVVPVVPAVVPPAVVAPAEVAPAELLLAGPIEAFVRMNDAALPAPDVERDALVLPVVPVVPVAPALSPCCRHPVTVTVAF